jgi:hypothetical protein
VTELCVTRSPDLAHRARARERNESILLRDERSFAELVRGVRLHRGRSHRAIFRMRCSIEKIRRFLIETNVRTISISRVRVGG